LAFRIIKSIYFNKFIVVHTLKILPFNLFSRPAPQLRIEKEESVIPLTWLQNFFFFQRSAKTKKGRQIKKNKFHKKLLSLIQEYLNMIALTGLMQLWS
jgi:hypothetical protein